MWFLFSFALMLVLLIVVNTERTDTSDKPDWSGTWRGLLTTDPTHAGPSGMEVTLELGPFPTAVNNCTLWRSTYRKDGKVQAIKDYRLCRRNSDEDLFTDERNGIILDTQWIGGTLISPYKADNVFYIVTNRMRGDIFEEEIVTVDDTSIGQGVQSLRTRAVYRMEMRRVKA